MTAPDFARSRRQLRRARVQSALTMARQGVDPRLHRDRLLELLAFERLDNELSFGQLTEDEVETIVAIALADVTDHPHDRIFVLSECINLLVRDGQFARVNLLAVRLRSAATQISSKRHYLQLATTSISFALTSNRRRALSDIDRATQFRSAGRDNSHSPDDKRDLAVLGAIREALLEENLDLCLRTRDLLTRMGDGLGVSLLDCAIVWQHARKAADPLSVLRAADATFDSKRMAEYVKRSGIDVLFPAQIKAIEGGLTRADPLTVSLPTSSGKTLLAEFRIAATLEREPQATAIYVAPYRLLARQVTRSLDRSLSRLGHVVQDLGGGFDVDGPAQYGNVLVCTPERLDALVRSAVSDPASAAVMDRCSLLVFDEMHLIGRSGRGPRFEMLLTRLKMHYSNLHFLALSAASQGVDEIAEWLTRAHLVKHGRRPTGTIEVSWKSNGEFVQRVDRKSPTLVAELSRTNKPLEDAVLLISRLSTEYRPVLAVCTQRSYAESLASKVVETDPLGSRLWIDDLRPDQVEQLNAVIDVVSSMMGAAHPLTVCLQNGVGFHHAGVPSTILGLIEELAAERILRTVAATTTVAEGADLPFRAVVIPHLNFQGNSNRLERDLYLNIIGRAGRVNVAIEGVVFILESNARTLQNHVNATLWTTAEVGRVRGQLTEITPYPTTPDETAWFQEFESQVMGWLGDGSSYKEDQAELLSSNSFTFSSGTSQQRGYVKELTQTVLDSLEERGLAIAGSPYKLTDRGERARLTGLNGFSAARLETAIHAGRTGWLPTLLDIVELTQPQINQLARTVFESSETMAKSLWLRRSRKTELARSTYLADFCAMTVDEHVDAPLFWAELGALTMWISGESFEAIADSMPTFGGSGLFGSKKLSSRISDVAEYVSKVGYPGSWTWSAAKTLAREIHGIESPGWLSGAIEYGAPTETAVYLMRTGRLSRPGALTLAKQLGPSWSEATELILEDGAELAEDLNGVDNDRFEEMVFLMKDGI